MSDLERRESGEESAVLPKERLGEIAAIASTVALEKQRAAAQSALEALDGEDEKLTASIKAARAEADAAREKAEKWAQRLRQKEEAAAKLEERRAQTAKRREEIELELAELAKQRTRLEAQRLFRAFQASGRSMDELMDFLGCTAEQIAPPEEIEEPAAAPAPQAEPETKRRRTRQSFDAALEPEFQALWQQIEAAQGEEFTTARGLPFRYEVRGRQLFVDRKEKPISESSLKIAFTRVKTCSVDGPKALQTFGAPYVWGIFKKLGVVRREDEPLQQHDGAAVDSEAESGRAEGEQQE